MIVRGRACFIIARTRRFDEMLLRCVLLVLLPVAWAQCKSNPGSPCTSTCNGTTLNIKDLFHYPISFNATNPAYIYWFNPCDGYECGLEKPQTKDNAMCQVNPDNGDKYSLGKVNTAQWYINKTADGKLMFTIFYTGGDSAGVPARSTMVTFQIAEPTGLKYLSQNSQTYQYAFTVSVSSFGGGGDISGYIGLIFIFLTIGAFITYFIVGGLIMYFAKGARGVEVIPNLNYWKDLPLLLRDAIFFIISPCYKREGYEKI